jgi:hypothetical protein
MGTFSPNFRTFRTRSAQTRLLSQRYGRPAWLVPRTGVATHCRREVTIVPLLTERSFLYGHVVDVRGSDGNTPHRRTNRVQEECVTPGTKGPGSSFKEDPPISAAPF